MARRQLFKTHRAAVIVGLSLGPAVLTSIEICDNFNDPSKNHYSYHMRTLLKVRIDENNKERGTISTKEGFMLKNGWK